MISFSFDAKKEESFDNSLKEGSYPVTIVEATYKPSKSNPNNFMISVVYQISGDSFNGWKIYDNFNVVNSNELAQKIGRSDLKAMCESCGLGGFGDPSELIGESLMVTTKNKVFNGRENPNVVKYAPISQGEKTPNHLDDIPFG